MIAKVSVFIATSLDGFIARKDGSLDWLDQANASVPKGEDCGFYEFLNSVDALVMGRNTFEQVLSFNQWPYGDKPVVVLSSKQVEIPDSMQKSVSTTSESPQKLCDRLASKGFRHLYIDGGLTIQSFLKENLIDELTITLIPVILGEGKTLFQDLGKDIMIKHIATKTFDFGFVQLRYLVQR